MYKTSVAVGIAAVLSVAGVGRADVPTAVVTTLATFTFAGGRYPEGSGVIADPAGNLYGTTQGGGSQGDGVAFRYAPATGTLTTLASFDGVPSATNFGGHPMSGVAADAAGNLYGTAENGGVYGRGAVFRLAAGTGTPSAVVSFTGNADGAYPVGGLVVDRAGNLFGTTAGGGTGTAGTVFEIPAGSSAVTTLATFVGPNGSSPSGTLVADAAGDLYGTTRTGGASFGTADPNSGSTGGAGSIFKVAAGTGTLTTVASFNYANGNNPISGLFVDAAGDLFGTTAAGGAYGDGTVFEVAAGSSAVTTLVSFNGTDGTDPHGGLIADAAGRLYGTTVNGGASNLGTVFSVDPTTDALTTLVSFNRTNGAFPESTLLADAAGDLFGTADGGGALNDGTIFELTGVGFAVPEPAGVGLVAIAGSVLAARRRRRRTRV